MKKILPNISVLSIGLLVCITASAQDTAKAATATSEQQLADKLSNLRGRKIKR